jgi:phenylacetate-CoA ligase
MFEEAVKAELEFGPEALIRQQQDALLRSHVRTLAELSPYYRRRFAEGGIEPEAVRGCRDLPLLPFTGKEDLERENRDFLCVSETEIVDLCLTSGTTGTPVPLWQTRRDLERLACNEEVSFRRMGIGPADRVLVAVALDRCFMAGMAYFLGLTRIGATAIRGGSGSLAHLVELVRYQRPTAIVGVPTLLLALADRLQAEGAEPTRAGVRRLVCIGEPVRGRDLRLSPLGERLRGRWQATVFGTYASTEMATAFSDCEAGMGGHLSPELIVVEIVDEQGRMLPPGEPGEVVATPLLVTGMPLLRFRTGDIAILHTEPCACGRLSPRLGPVLGRKAQMLKMRGTTVYPPGVFAVLQEFAPVCGYYLEVFDDFALSERLRVVVASRDPALTAETVAERLAARLRVKPEVVIAPAEEVAAKTTQDGKRKPVVFFDYRTHRP